MGILRSVEPVSGGLWLGGPCRLGVAGFSVPIQVFGSLGVRARVKRLGARTSVWRFCGVEVYKDMALTLE